MERNVLPEPSMAIHHEGVRLRYYTPNAQTRWRVETLYTKEPDTIDWLGAMTRDDVLFDIGANVGMYSIFAAATRGTRVFAFEPEAQNYSILNTNIHGNGLDDLVCAYCVAAAGQFAFDRLNLSTRVPGGSLHSFAEARDDQDKPFAPAFRQGAVAFTLDELVTRCGLPVPTHIKIDVDGIEPDIVRGGRSVLENPVLRSVLVELNTARDDHWEVVDTLLELGFDYSEEQAQGARRDSGRFAGIGNYVFRR